MPSTFTLMPLKSRLDDRDKAFLTQTGAALKVSLYLPFDRTWGVATENRIQLADLRREAARALEARGALSGGIEAILGPVDALLANPDVSRITGAGVALFSDGEQALAIALPEAPAPSVQVDTFFRLDGILPAFYGRDRFYLLCLSQHHVRLWDCDAIAMREIPLDGIETDIRELPGFEGSEYQSVVHSISSGNGGGRDASFAGIGSGDGKVLKTEIEGFFRRIDKGIQARLPEPGLPLILSGVGFLIPIYRKAANHRAMHHRDLPGNPESFGGLDRLHMRANALMRETECEARNAALKTYLANLAGARSCAGYTDVVPCASRNRLTHLFLSQGRTQWGEYETASGRTTVFGEFQGGAVDLSNLACVHALRGHAQVFAVPGAEMPVNAPIAALFRE
jgi:hypothetical protein